MNKKILHIFTNNYPYKKNDYIFFRDEVKLLEKKFDTIIMYTMHKGTLKIKNLKKKIIIDNSIHKKIYDKKNFFKNFLTILFCRYLWFEIFKLKKINVFKKLKILLISRYKAEVIYDYLKNKNIKNDFFFSFWSNSVLIAFYFLKKKKLIRNTFSRILGSDIKGHIPNDSFIGFEKIKFSKLSFILALNNEHKKILKEKKLIDKKKIYKNYLGIEKKKLQLHYKEKIIKFASCGRLIHVKNNLEIFKFVKNFSLKNPDFKIFYYCVGKGEEKNKLLNYAKINFSENVKFIYIDKIPSLVKFLQSKKVNFFLNLSHSEGVSFAVMEALSCSIPIICSKIPGNKEIINKKNGYLIDSFNDYSYSSISIKIRRDYLNKEKYIKKRISSHQSVLKKICRKKNQLLLNKILDKNLI